MLFRSVQILLAKREKCPTIKITFEVKAEPFILIKFALASIASALARRVFTVPGGPKSKIPLGLEKVSSN